MDHKRITELYATVILGLATILAAWSAFQAAKWSGVQSIAFSESAAARTMGTRYASQADQELVLDVGVFVAWMQAVAEDFTPADLMARGYEPKPSSLSTFLYKRFPKALEPAVQAWLEQHPFQNPAAPATPFEMPEYKHAGTAQAAQLFAKADARAADAREYNLRSDHYVALTVMFAAVLFLGGLATKLDARLAERVLLAISTALVIGGFALLLAFPVTLR